MAMSNLAGGDEQTLAQLEDAKSHHNSIVHRTANPRVSWHNCGVCITMDLRIKAARGRSTAETLKGLTDDELIAAAAGSIMEHREEPESSAPPLIEEIPLLKFPQPLPSAVYCSEEDFRTLRPTDKPGAFRRKRLSPKEGAARITAWMQCGGDRHMIIERFGFDRYHAIYSTAYTYRSALPREVWRVGWGKQPQKGEKTGNQSGHPVKPVFDTPEGISATPVLEAVTEPTSPIETTGETEFERELATLRMQLAQEHDRAEHLRAELERARRPFILKRAARTVWKRLRAVARAIAKGE